MFQRNLCDPLVFPERNEAEKSVTPLRMTRIPVSFPSVAAYKQIFSAALKGKEGLLYIPWIDP